MYYRNEGEGGGGRGIGEGKKKKRKKRIFMELMACSLFRNSRLFLPPFFFFFFYSAPDANSGLFAHCYSGQGISDVTR